MPVILRVKGYKFWFYEADRDEPPHVHVGRAGKEAKYWLEPDIELAKNYRLSRAQLKEIEQLIEDHGDEIKRAWKKHFGS